MSTPKARLPLVDYLQGLGYELVGKGETVVVPSATVKGYGDGLMVGLSEGSMTRTTYTRIKDGDAEEVLLSLLEHFQADPETDYLEHTVSQLEAALAAIKARIEGEYDHPALLRVGALGDKGADIIRIIEEVLHE